MPQARPIATHKDEARYRALLFQHLAGQPEGEIAFFVNARRFAVLDGLIGDRLTDGASVLNVASGPFALEFYALGGTPDIVSLDIEPALAPLHQALVAEGLIPPSSFAISDVMAFETDRRFDVVIINDLFFHKFVDFYAAIDKYASLVKPGGHLYFDILDERAAGLWRLINNDDRYRRYDMASVRRKLTQHGLEILAEQPSMGIKGGVDGLARRGLWHLCGIANNKVFSTRRAIAGAEETLRLEKQAGSARTAGPKDHSTTGRSMAAMTSAHEMNLKLRVKPSFRSS